MADANKIRELFAKACDYYVNSQQKEGNWTVESEALKEPNTFQKDIVITAQNLRALIQIGNYRALQHILKAFYYVSEYDLETKDPLEWWARKLLVLNVSNTKESARKKEEIANFILRSQKKEGCWYSFPYTFNLTNAVILDALVEYGKIPKTECAVEWFKKNRAEDSKGWGKDNESKISEYTFTSNIINSLILLGENPAESYIQKAAKFLESGQSESGGWPSTKLTTTRVTTYSTAIAVLALMLTSKEPFNKKVEKGIEFLIKSASKEGGWPLIPNEKPKYYTTYYVIDTLAFYLYLKEKLETSEAKSLMKYMTLQQATAHYYMKFEKETRELLEKMFIEALFNSKAIASTSSAIERRREILKILSEKGPKDIAAIIDELKKMPAYASLNKKSHMTQIKADIEYLKDIRIVGQVYDLFFVCNAFYKL